MLIRGPTGDSSEDCHTKAPGVSGKMGWGLDVRMRSMGSIGKSHPGGAKHGLRTNQVPEGVNNLLPQMVKG